MDTRRTHNKDIFLFLICLLIPICGIANNSDEEVWDTYSDTWVATDALGRTLPNYEEVGPPRKDKYVGIFYFRWFDGGPGPFDISKILTQNPEAVTDPNCLLWGPIWSFHYWGEPLFGYYLNDDEWVLRKHAQMLSDAGVDTVICDSSNPVTHVDYSSICQVFSQIRNEGGKTPQITFLEAFTDPANEVKRMYREVYKEGLYSDLWFRWEGKPLILADRARSGASWIALPKTKVVENLFVDTTLGQSFTVDKPVISVGGEFGTYVRTDAGMTLSLYRDGPHGQLIVNKRFENIVDNSLVSLDFQEALPPGNYYLESSHPKELVVWWSDQSDIYDQGQAFRNGQPSSGDRTLWVTYAETKEMLDFFTFRKVEPDVLNKPGTPPEWGWLNIYPQKIYSTPRGEPEEITVGIAQNVVDGHLSVMSNPKAYGRSFEEGKPYPSKPDNSGRNFAQQWQRALEIDPSFIFVTSWNEWIAQRFDKDLPIYGATPVTFVDSFSQEYSRDIEPMKGGHTDNYYYQLISNIRRFKGVREPPAASPPKTIQIDGDFSEWKEVLPEFRDDCGDTAHRNHKGWGNVGIYHNESGRNNFVLLKVTHDNDFIYFYAQTREPITNYRDKNWMLLSIDTNEDLQCGKKGRHFVVNQRVLDAHRTSLNVSIGSWKHRIRVIVDYRVVGKEIELAVPRKHLGLEDLTKPLQFDFKWMDHIKIEKDMMEIYLNGDTAPNGRFKYRFLQSK